MGMRGGGRGDMGAGPSRGKLIDAAALQAYLGVGADRVREWVDAGLPCYQDAPGARRWFHLDLVDDWFAARMRSEARRKADEGPAPKAGGKGRGARKARARVEGPYNF
jgi:phage terminase Nu1 subunit (DNA packaging protein)